MKLEHTIAALVSIALLVVSGVSFAGGPASDKKMADEALAVRAGKKDGSGRQHQRLLQMRERNQRLANEKPHEVLTASVVFNTGMMVEDLVPLQEPAGAEIMNMEFKLPVGHEGQILTVFSGTAILLETEGGFGDRARMAMARLKGDYQQMLDAMSGELRADREDVVRLPWFIYRVEMIGPVSYLVGVENRPNVAAVLINERIEDVESYQTAKAEYEEAHRTAR